VRLLPLEIKIIKNTISNYIQNATIILFGSRIDDSKKGGDIDLLVQTSSNITLKDKINILTQLELNGISRKVDLLLQTPKSKEQSIFKTALQEGVVL
jgi:predicted nucleotidyltransferase